ncbi:MAG: hypothetical protein ACUVT7_02185 [Thermoplasmata archaeon]
MNVSGTKAEGRFVALVEGFYIFQFLIAGVPEGTELRVHYDVYKEAPLDEPAVLARIPLVIGSYLSAIAIIALGRSRKRRKQVQDVRLMTYWEFLTSRWRYWSPTLAGMTIPAVLFVLELTVFTVFPRWMEPPFDLGRVVKFWGLSFGIVLGHFDWKNLLKSR